MSDIRCDMFDYKRDSLVDQRALFKDAFPERVGTEAANESHYFWKFHSFPDSPGSYEYSAYHENKMVGYYAALPYRYIINGREMICGMVCDVMTHSSMRGRGVFTSIGRYATDDLKNKGLHFTSGYPIRPEVIPGHIKVGWKIPFSMPLYMKFIRLNALLSAKKLGFLVPLANIFISTYNSIVKTKLNKKYSFTLSTNIKKVPGYDSFAKEWCASVPNALIKDLPFALWRYSAPGSAYKFLSINDADGKMIGFVSFRNIIKEGIPSYGILDYMVLPGYKNCHGLINRVLTDCAKKDKVEAIMTMMSKKSAVEYQLTKNGFLKSPFVFQLIIKNLTKEFSDEVLFNEKNWHLMWIDSDDL